MSLPPELLSYLRKAERIVALTGAGVSQESGLATFRDAQTGHWAQYRPEDLATPEAFARTPKLVWDWYAMRRENALAAAPNPGHFALAEWQKRLPGFILITQNVDGLHQRAGSAKVIELHGNITRVKCANCDHHPQAWSPIADSVPRCARCNGLLRPDVVWFGENLPPEALSAAIEAADHAQAFFSIGTSGVVQPAASLAYAAKTRGALVIEINFEPTPLTTYADYAFHGKSGEILPQLLAAL
jgi:NAD-dependent deacetylase